MIASLVHDWFGWPNGAVLTNLVASAICVALGAWKIIVWARKLAASHDDLHKKLDKVHTHLGIEDESQET